MKHTEVLTIMQEYVNKFDEFKSAYFWKPDATASGRRYYEKKNSLGTTLLEYDGHTYTLTFIIHCSCRNIYVEKEVLKDGVKTTITVIKNILKKAAIAA